MMAARTNADESSGGTRYGVGWSSARLVGGRGRIESNQIYRDLGERPCMQKESRVKV